MSLRSLGRWLHHTITSSDKRPYIEASLEELEALAGKSLNTPETFRLLGILDELTYRITSPDKRDRVREMITQQLKNIEGITVSSYSNRSEIAKIRGQLLARYAEKSESETKALEEEEKKRLAAEAEALEEREKKRLAAEAKALEEEERKRLAAEAKALEEEERKRLAAEAKAREEEKKARKQAEQKAAAAEKKRLAAEAKAREEEEKKRLAAEAKALEEEKMYKQKEAIKLNQEDNTSAKIEKENKATDTTDKEINELLDIAKRDNCPAENNEKGAEVKRNRAGEETEKKQSIKLQEKECNIPELSTELKPGTYNSLRRNGIRAARDLSNITSRELLQMKNIGPMKAKEIIELLRSCHILNPKLAASEETSDIWQGNELKEEYLEEKIIIAFGLSENEQEFIASKEKCQIPSGEVQLSRKINEALRAVDLADDQKTTVEEIMNSILCDKSLSVETRLTALKELEKEVLEDGPILKSIQWVTNERDRTIAKEVARLCSYRELRYSILYRIIVGSKDNERVKIRWEELSRMHIRLKAEMMITSIQERGIDDRNVEILLEILQSGSGDSLFERCEKIEEDWIKGKTLDVLIDLVAGIPMSHIGEKIGISREGVRQIKTKLKQRYSIELPENQSEKKKEEDLKAYTAHSERFCRITADISSTEYSTLDSTLKDRVDAYRYFNSPIPSAEYKKHLHIIESSSDKSRIGIGYWDDDSNLRGLLWVIIAERAEGSIMPKQVTLPVAIKAAIQKFGGQSEVATLIGVEYKGQVVGTEGRSFWTNEIIRETFKKVQKEYCLPHDIMPEQNHIADFVDCDGNSMTKGSSCIAAIKREHGSWDGYARHAEMKIYNQSTKKERNQIDKQILEIFWEKSGGFSSERSFLESFNDFMSNFWKSTSDPSRYTSLIGLSRRFGEKLRIMRQEEIKELRICQLINMLGEGEASVSREEHDIDRFLDLLF